MPRNGLRYWPWGGRGNPVRAEEGRGVENCLREAWRQIGRVSFKRTSPSRPLHVAKHPRRGLCWAAFFFSKLLFLVYGLEEEIVPSLGS